MRSIPRTRKCLWARLTVRLIAQAARGELRLRGLGGFRGYGAIPVDGRLRSRRTPERLTTAARDAPTSRAAFYHFSRVRARARLIAKSYPAVSAKSAKSLFRDRIPGPLARPQDKLKNQAHRRSEARRSCAVDREEHRRCAQPWQSPRPLPGRARTLRASRPWNRQSSTPMPSRSTPPGHRCRARIA